MKYDSYWFVGFICKINFELGRCRCYQTPLAPLAGKFGVYDLCTAIQSLTLRAERLVWTWTKSTKSTQVFWGFQRISGLHDDVWFVDDNRATCLRANSTAPCQVKFDGSVSTFPTLKDSQVQRLHMLRVAALRKLAELSICLKSVTIRSAFRPRRGTANAEMSANLATPIKSPGGSIGNRWERRMLKGQTLSNYTRFTALVQCTHVNSKGTVQSADQRTLSFFLANNGDNLDNMQVWTGSFFFRWYVGILGVHHGAPSPLTMMKIFSLLEYHSKSKGPKCGLERGLRIWCPFLCAILDLNRPSSLDFFFSWWLPKLNGSQLSLGSCPKGHDFQQAIEGTRCFSPMMLQHQKSTSYWGWISKEWIGALPWPKNVGLAPRYFASGLWESWIVTTTVRPLKMSQGNDW